jgi:hypothetical protein
MTSSTPNLLPVTIIVMLGSPVPWCQILPLNRMAAGGISALRLIGAS